MNLILEVVGQDSARWTVWMNFGGWVSRGTIPKVRLHYLGHFLATRSRTSCLYMDSS